MDELTVSLVTEELGRGGCAGIATAVGANSLACYPILIAGNEEQKKNISPWPARAALLVLPDRA